MSREPERIVTRCPACGCQTLFIGSGGHLTCSNLNCPNPSVDGCVSVLRKKIYNLRQAVRALAHGEHSGRAFANDVLYRIGAEINRDDPEMDDHEPEAADETAHDNAGRPR